MPIRKPKKLLGDGYKQPDGPCPELRPGAVVLGDELVHQLVEHEAERDGKGRYGKDATRKPSLWPTRPPLRRSAKAKVSTTSREYYVADFPCACLGMPTSLVHQNHI